MRIQFQFGLAGLMMLALAPAASAQMFNYDDMSNLTDDAAKAMIETIGISTDHRSFLSAAPLGTVIGLDLGIGVTAFSVPQKFKDAMALAENDQDIPSILPVPRLILTKGLPLGIDVGGSWVGYDGNSIWGFEVKKAWIDNVALPVVSTRASYTKATIAYLKASTIKVDAVASKNLVVIDPYIGLGMQFVSGTVDVPESSGIDPDITKQSRIAPHVYVGLPINLVFMRLAAEYDRSFAGINTFGAKLSLNF